MTSIPPTHSLVQRQVKQMFEAAEARWPGLPKRLASDTIAVLSELDEIDVQLVPDLADPGDNCSVAGYYRGDAHPPQLCITRSASAGRQAFSALHEFGHHLQQTEVPLASALAQQGDGGFQLEELACDTFAAEILMPEALVSKHISDRGPTAHSVVALWRTVEASRQAVVVRAGQSLRTPGVVAVLDADGVVEFSYARELPRVRRGSDQSQLETFRGATRSTTGHASGRERLLYRDGILGSELYVDVHEIGGRFVVVAVEDHAPWLKFSPPPPSRGPSARYWTCERDTCGEVFQAFERPCPSCDTPKCPECRYCRCATRIAERQCTRCNFVFQEHRFAPGSDVCEDCA